MFDKAANQSYTNLTNMVRNLEFWTCMSYGRKDEEETDDDRGLLYPAVKSFVIARAQDRIRSTVLLFVACL